MENATVLNGLACYLAAQQDISNPLWLGFVKYIVAGGDENDIDRCVSVMKMQKR